jgi:23S rRNA-intervening sequence protein
VNGVEKIYSFKDLKVWQKGIDIVKEVYKLCARFPKDEVYGKGVKNE